MARGRRIALVVALAAYLAVGLLSLYLFTPDVEEPKADESLIDAFFDSLQVDTLRHPPYTRSYNIHKYDSLKAVWQAERLHREAIRLQRRDSARRYWDSVRASRDSLRARKDSAYKALKTVPDRPVNVATADADSLQLVPGIGPVLSRMIVEYREALGGFVTLNQVLEAGQIPVEALDYMYLPAVAVRRLNVNRDNLQWLRRHPYISGRQAIAIGEVRRKAGKISGWHELLRLPEFTPSDQERLEPYIVF